MEDNNKWLPARLQLKGNNSINKIKQPAGGQACIVTTMKPTANNNLNNTLWGLVKFHTTDY